TPGTAFFCLRVDAVNAQLLGRAVATPHAEEQAVQLGCPERSASAGSGRHVGDFFEVVGAQCGNHGDESAAAGDIDAAMGGVVPDVIRLGGAGNGGNDVAAIGIEDEQHSGRAADNEKVVTGFVERHGEVGVKLA